MPLPPSLYIAAAAAVVPNVILAYVLHLNFAHPRKLARAVNVYVILCICAVNDSNRPVSVFM